MSRLTSNFAANLVASSATAVIALFVIPLYIHSLGLERYGLIAFYLALRGFVQILDLGAGPVVNREVARYAVDRGAAPDARNALHTFERLYWLAGFLIGGIIFAAAPLIAGVWLKPQTLAPEQVTVAVRLIGLLLAVQWPSTFYQSALLGLERQVELNAVITAASVLTHLSALSLILTITPRVEAFFWCAIALSALQVVTLARLYSRSIAFQERPAFALSALRHVAGFAASVAVISVTGTILGQADKILLSAAIPLPRFAHYALAGVVAGALTIVVSPIFNTIYPRFSSLVAAKRGPELQELHHFGAQLVTLLVAPAALMVVFFARDLILLWTQSSETAGAVAPIAVLLACSVAVNGFMVLPYALQLANGWTRLGVIFGLSATALYLPLLWLMARTFGAVGAAATSLLLNVAYFVIVAPPTHMRLLPGSLAPWLVRDIALPTAAAATIAAIGAAIMPRDVSTAGHIIALGVIYLLTAAAAFVTAGRLRAWLGALIRRSASPMPSRRM